MSLLDKLRSFSKRIQEEKPVEKEEWELAKEIRLSDVERYKKYVKDYSEKINEYNKQGTDKNSYEYRDAVEQLNRFKYALFEAEKSIDFIRPNTTEDIEYRNNLYDSFAGNLKNVLPENLDLRFHGTPVYFAKEILESKQISSSADRFDGYISSTDRSGEISVADINGVPRVVDYFLDVPAHQRFLPCGCLFVLTGEGQTERQRKVSVMDNVNFGKNPERLYAVVSTPENISNLKNWLSEAGLSPDLAHTFDSFFNYIEKQKEQIKAVPINSDNVYSGLDIAKYIVSKYKDSGENINNLKLQKILYYSELASFAVNGKSIIADDFEAWRHGPVVRDVYNEYRKYLQEPIELLGSKSAVILDNDTKVIIDKVVDSTLKYSDWELAELSQKNSAFKEWYVRGQEYVVPKESIKNCRGDELLPNILGVLNGGHNMENKNRDLHKPNIATATDLSQYIVTKCTRDEQPITNLRLQQLLYLVQKEFVAKGEKAFPDDIIAKGFGPAVMTSYYRFGHYGSQDIHQTYPVNIKNYFDQEHIDIIDDIIVSCRDMWPWDVAELVCKPEGAWRKIYGNGEGDEKVISLQNIKDEITSDSAFDNHGKYKAMDIADYIVDFAKKENSPVSYLQLQRLLYYVNGEYYKAKGEFLVKERFYVNHTGTGPENRNARGVYYAYGANKIGATPKNVIQLPQSDKSLVDSIVKEYMVKHPQEMYRIINSQNSAITKTINELGAGNRIKDEYIKSEFKSAEKTQEKHMSMSDWNKRIELMKQEKNNSNDEKTLSHSKGRER